MIRTLCVANLKNRYAAAEISCCIPAYFGRGELQTYAESSVRQGLAVDYFRLGLKLARARSKPWFLFGLPSAPRYDASPMGANVYRHCLIGKQQFFRDYKAYWDCQGDALFISSVEAHLTKISPRPPLLVAWGGQNCSQIVLTRLSESPVFSRTWLCPLPA